MSGEHRRTERLIIVTDKGGVGKSTVTAALGLAASRRGLRTLLVEVGERSDVMRLLGKDVGLDPTGETARAPRLDRVGVARRAALLYYLRSQVPGRLAGTMLMHSKIFGLLVDAAPGLRSWVVMNDVATRHGSSSYPCPVRTLHLVPDVERE